MLDGGVHLADVVRRCFGLPTELKQLTARFDRALPAPDTAIAVLQFESGAVGTWTSCFSVPYDGPMLRVRGSKATAELFYHELRVTGANGRVARTPSGADSFVRQFEHFCDVVKRGKPVAITPAEALDDLALIAAIVK